MSEHTAGQALAAEIRSMYRINTRSRWGTRRNQRIVRLYPEVMIEDVWGAIGEYRGIESPERTAILSKAHTALCAWFKFVGGYRIDGVLRFAIMDLGPAAFAAFLGEMVDSGCTNNGEFEQWFTAKAREAHAARAAAAASR